MSVSLTTLHRKSTKRWLQKQAPDDIEVIWVPLSLFDTQSQFTFRYRKLVLDVKIERERMTVTSFGAGEFCRVSFHSEEEFRIFLRMELRKQIKLKTVPPAPEIPLDDFFN